MKPQKMISDNDCFRTCIACLLDVPTGDVPNFANSGQDMWQAARDWLKPNGLALWVTPFAGTATLDEVLQSIAAVNPGIYYMVGGFGGYDDHIVIALDDAIVHDPARMGGGLTRAASNGFWMVVTLVSERLTR